MRSIGGRLGNLSSGGGGATIEIPLLMSLASNLCASRGTMPGRQFDWGGRLLNSNGGAQRFPQSGWKSLVECIGIRELDCETYKSSRQETGAK
jgi:hypothetical protein